MPGLMVVLISMQISPKWTFSLTDITRTCHPVKRIYYHVFIELLFIGTTKKSNNMHNQSRSESHK